MALYYGCMPTWLKPWCRTSCLAFLPSTHCFHEKQYCAILFFLPVSRLVPPTLWCARGVGGAGHAMLRNLWPRGRHPHSHPHYPSFDMDFGSRQVSLASLLLPATTQQCCRFWEQGGGMLNDGYLGQME